MTSRLRFCLVLILCIWFVTGKKHKNKGGETKSNAEQSTDAPPQQAPDPLGLNVEAKPYDSSGNVNNTLLYLYPGAKPVVLSVPAKYLQCDFEKSCCWRNAKPPADQMEFVLSEGDIPPPILEKYLGTSEPPKGHFLVTGTVNEAGPNSQALFVSCTLECTQEPIKVSLKHWHRGCKLDVCTQDAKAKDGELENCQEVPQEGEPGPTEITLPPSPHTNIVIRGSKFARLSLAIIDEIEITSTPCPPPTTTPMPTTTTTTTTTKTTTTTTTTPKPETGPNNSDAVCPAVLCNFEEDSSCNWYNTPNEHGGKAKKWKVVKGKFQNGATGIAEPGAGRAYLATYLKPKDVASLETKSDFPHDLVVRFLVYQITDKIELKGCCDDIKNCPYVTKSITPSNYKQWMQGSFLCKGGTKKVLFHAVNNGGNEGAIGLDNTHLLLPSGGSPDSASERACLQK